MRNLASHAMASRSWSARSGGERLVLVLSDQALERLDLAEAHLDQVVVAFHARLSQRLTGSFHAGLDLLLELAQGNRPFLARPRPSTERAWKRPPAERVPPGPAPVLPVATPTGNQLPDITESDLGRRG